MSHTWLYNFVRVKEYKRKRAKDDFIIGTNKEENKEEKKRLMG